MDGGAWRPLVVKVGKSVALLFVVGGANVVVKLKGRRSEVKPKVTSLVSQKTTWTPGYHEGTVSQKIWAWGSGINLETRRLEVKPKVKGQPGGHGGAAC